MNVTDSHSKEGVAAVDSDEPPQLSLREPLQEHRLHRLRERIYEDRRSDRFRKRFYPEVSLDLWHSWHWQVANRVHSLEGISRFFPLNELELAALEQGSCALPFSVTPYYLSTIDVDDPQDPIRKTVVPTLFESVTSFGESIDPLSEHSDSPTDCIVHRYPDRVLFLASRMCAMYCRYCTRSRMVGGHIGSLKAHWDEGIEYVRQHEEVRDVLISGGDPLLLSDQELEYIISRLSVIEHVDIIRIGTKAPMVLPMRITPSLVRMLRKYRPLYMSIHCTHPQELTPLAARALERLSDAGIVLGSQTVLLKGINDSSEVLKNLYHGLLALRVRPYYLYQCDPIVGSAHFRTSVETGKRIIGELRGYTSGYAIPHYIIDAPKGGGKIPILPEYEVGRDSDNLYLKNYEGKQFLYPDCQVPTLGGGIL